MLKKSFLFLIISCFIFACQQDKSEDYLSILKTEKGDFRGASIGNTIQQIKALENDSFLIDKMDDYLYYDYEINMGNSYTVSYDFSPKDELYEIEVTTYLDKIEDAHTLFTNFALYFDEKYGEKLIANDGFTTWKTPLKKQPKHIEFAMIDKSETYGIIIIKISDLDI